ncbi:MAG: hypothetical protein GQ546_10135 [Gammaproteobacteria bacterium]|nr:hypothetical protein [Gammaproteobacteria bacterium]
MRLFVKILCIFIYFLMTNMPVIANDILSQESSNNLLKCSGVFLAHLYKIKSSGDKQSIENAKTVASNTIAKLARLSTCKNPMKDTAILDDYLIKAKREALKYTKLDDKTLNKKINSCANIITNREIEIDAELRKIKLCNKINI